MILYFFSYQHKCILTTTRPLEISVSNTSPTCHKYSIGFTLATAAFRVAAVWAEWSLILHFHTINNVQKFRICRLKKRKGTKWQNLELYSNLYNKYFHEGFRKKTLTDKSVFVQHFQRLKDGKRRMEEDVLLFLWQTTDCCIWNQDVSCCLSNASVFAFGQSEGPSRCPDSNEASLQNWDSED